MANRRIVLVIRKDLELPVGLAMAQAAHLCDEWLRQRVLKAVDSPRPTPKDDDCPPVVNLYDHFAPDEIEWMESPTVSVLSVNTPEELEIIRDEAKENGLPVHEWSDTIHSGVLDRFINAVPVGISIGPSEDDLIKPVTGKLPLY